MFPQRVALEEQLLAQMHTQADYAQGYGPANVLALLRQQRGHLRGLDLSILDQDIRCICWHSPLAEATSCSDKRL